MSSKSTLCSLFVRAPLLEDVAHAVSAVYREHGLRQAAHLRDVRLQNPSTTPWADDIVVIRAQEPPGFFGVATQNHEFTDVDENTLAAALSRSYSVYCMAEGKDYQGVACYRDGAGTAVSIAGDRATEGYATLDPADLITDVSAESDAQTLAASIGDIETFAALLGFELSGGLWRLGERPLRTSFGFTTRATTMDAGRRSSTSVTSSPIRSNASSPLPCTSWGSTSMSTRGRCSGRGRRPVGLRRSWARTCSTGRSSMAAASRSLSTIDSISKASCQCAGRHPALGVLLHGGLQPRTIMERGNEAGGQGWEMVAAVGSTRVNGLWCFKRAK